MWFWKIIITTNTFLHSCFWEHKARHLMYDGEITKRSNYQPAIVQLPAHCEAPSVNMPTEFVRIFFSHRNHCLSPGPRLQKLCGQHNIGCLQRVVFMLLQMRLTSPFLCHTLRCNKLETPTRKFPPKWYLSSCRNLSLQPRHDEEVEKEKKW